MLDWLIGLRTFWASYVKNFSRQALFFSIFYSEYGLGEDKEEKAVTAELCYLIRK